MRNIGWLTALSLGVLLLAAACAGDEEAQPSATPTATATPVEPPPTGSPIIDVSPTATATIPPATPTPVPTPDLPPGAVTGFLAGPGAGSGEVMLTWEAGPEPDLDHYNIYRSTSPGEPYMFLKSVPDTPDPSFPDGIRGTWDYPVPKTKYCYIVRAVDAAGNEGARSREYCSAGTT